MVGDVAHGFIVDDGTATVTRAAPSLQLHVGGRGMEIAPAGSRKVELDFEHVSVEPDTVPCRVQP
jgi:hypothetical protein